MIKPWFFSKRGATTGTVSMVLATAISKWAVNNDRARMA